jgi:hypothetical protein
VADGKEKYGNVYDFFDKKDIGWKAHISTDPFPEHIKRDDINKRQFNLGSEIDDVHITASKIILNENANGF